MYKAIGLKQNKTAPLRLSICKGIKDRTKQKEHCVQHYTERYTVVTETCHGVSSHDGWTWCRTPRLEWKNSWQHRALTSTSEVIEHNWDKPSLSLAINVQPQFNSVWIYFYSTFNKCDSHKEDFQQYKNFISNIKDTLLNWIIEQARGDCSKENLPGIKITIMWVTPDCKSFSFYNCIIEVKLANSNSFAQKSSKKAFLEVWRIL